MAPTAVADDDAVPSFSSANFVEGERSLKNLIKFPKVKGDLSIVVNCTSIGSAKGRIRDAKCSATDDPSQKFAIAVSRRSRSARITPAIVDGKNEQVDFQFNVVFIRTGETETIDVYTNNRKNLDRFGPDYISAQRYSPYELPDVCKERRASYLILEIAVVTKEGRVKESDLHVDSIGIAKVCETSLREITRSSRFVPAFHDGLPVESIWVNPLIATPIKYRGI
ncbi:MAG: hypothetical protein O7H40_11290 [Gammaproteobacteria bacterium]|nr:hypothetical protein [Gammaproteobacteria bacterium]